MRNKEAQPERSGFASLFAELVWARRTAGGGLLWMMDNE
jgi:hypothetical protein